ncbi:farnesyl transferase beta subunit isoform X2 [Rhynchophorus ferrugineus]|uniref:farnesyl transferase beta subunit isoform X2 n=1 Tax=Rhynchophorus ferrugineus TaxID=354439 RepID=UPI003FCD117B
METILQLRNINEIKKYLTHPDSCLNKTTEDQITVEKLVFKKFEELHNCLRVNENLPHIFKEQHKKFLSDSLAYLPSSYETLDASRPWLCYWILHPLSLLGVKLEDSYKNRIANFLAKCQSPNGGFGGGPGQYPHLAPTYAAVNALVILGTDMALKVINRQKLFEFLQSVKQPDGSFAMHVGGEVDIRGAYCALSVASLTGVLTKELVNNTAEWIIRLVEECIVMVIQLRLSFSCQTYEGGFAGCPGLEAHGGYAFCGLAALVILNKGHMCDNQALLRWLVQKQMGLEGGFQGRTNKLVDSCYSFWQGGAFPLLYTLLMKEGITPSGHLFNEGALQEYILICCQNHQGGLVDKPGKPRDIYHSCYSISGLSIAQHFLDQKHVLSSFRNELASTHPLYNVRPDLVRKALLYFHSLPSNTAT